MDPNKIVGCPSSPTQPVLGLSDIFQRGGQAIKALKKSAQIIKNDEAITELSIKLTEIWQKIAFYRMQKKHNLCNDVSEDYNELIANTKLHHRINSLLHIFTAEPKTIPDSMESVPAIKSCYDSIFRYLKYQDANPIEFADADPYNPELTYWELLLQIRGRCQKIENILDERKLTAKIMQEYFNLKRQLKKAQDEEHNLLNESKMKSNMILEIQKKLNDDNENVELKHMLRGAEEEEDRLRGLLKQQKEGISLLQKEYENKINEFQQVTKKEIEANELQMLETQKKLREENRELREQNGNLRTTIKELYTRIDELSEASKKQPILSPIPELKEEIVEVVSEKKQPDQISVLQEEIKRLHEENIFYKSEFQDVLQLQERARNQLKEKDAHAQQIEQLKKDTLDFFSTVHNPENRDKSIVEFLMNVKKTLEL